APANRTHDVVVHVLETGFGVQITGAIVSLDGFAIFAGRAQPTRKLLRGCCFGELIAHARTCMSARTASRIFRKGAPGGPLNHTQSTPSSRAPYCLATYWVTRFAACAVRKIVSTRSRSKIVPS